MKIVGLSNGQQQLLCLARVLLRKDKPKLLILDEATGSVDTKTDQLIQQTLRKSFSGSTVLSMAHRLHSIIDSHKVLVVDAGVVAEFDEPARLLKETKSMFSQMMNCQ